MVLYSSSQYWDRACFHYKEKKRTHCLLLLPNIAEAGSNSTHTISSTFVHFKHFLFLKILQFLLHTSFYYSVARNIFLSICRYKGYCLICVLLPKNRTDPESKHMMRITLVSSLPLFFVALFFMPKKTF